MKYRLEINGQRRQVDVAADTPLLWVLREELGLVGTKYACGVAQCGACTVHVAGRATRSCVMPIAALDNRPVTTIEGATGGVAEAVMQSWQSLQVPQCGYCQVGQMMSAIALLQRKAKPTDDDIDGALAGNVCRCATYPRIRRAVHTAAAKAAR